MKKYEINKSDEVRKTIDLPVKLVQELEGVAKGMRMTIKAYLELIIIENSKPKK